MPTPLITWVMLALIAGILIGAALNEQVHREHDDDQEDGYQGGSYEWAESTLDWPDVPTIRVGQEWGENGVWGVIDEAATRAAHGATADALARRSLLRTEAPRADPKVRAILDAITSGLRADRERVFREAAGLPLLTVTCDRVDSQAAPFLLGDADFRRLVGCDRQAILHGLGFSDPAGR